VRLRHTCLGASYPVELVTGNHEDTTGPTGSSATSRRAYPIDRWRGQSHPQEYYIDYRLESAPCGSSRSPGLDLNANASTGRPAGTAH
jgi:hypothetical protein